MSIRRSDPIPRTFLNLEMNYSYVTILAVILVVLAVLVVLVGIIQRPLPSMLLLLSLFSYATLVALLVLVGFAMQRVGY
eukprot:g78972.t1